MTNPQFAFRIDLCAQAGRDEMVENKKRLKLLELGLLESEVLFFFVCEKSRIGLNDCLLLNGVSSDKVSAKVQRGFFAFTSNFTSCTSD